MICTICGHENADNQQLCEKCGHQLIVERDNTSVERIAAQPEAVHIASANSRTVASADIERVNQEPFAENQDIYYTSSIPEPGEQASGHYRQEVPQPNPYLESAKQNSKTYFNYFVEGLKNPFAVVQRVGAEHFLNGIISMVLFVLFLQLVLYQTLPGLSYFDFSLIKSFFWFTVFILLMIVYTFGAVKLSTHPRVSFKEIVARFGTMLIPFIVISIVGYLLILMGSSIGFALYSITMIGVFFTVPAVITMSFKRDNTRGLDPLYAIILTYVAIFLTLMLIGSSIDLYLKNSLFGF